MRIPRFVPLLVAVPLLAVAVLFIVGQIRAVEGFRPVKGRVIGVASTSCGGSGGHTCWRPVVEYSLDGRTVHTLRSQDRLRAEPDIGSELALLVNPRMPGDARIDSRDGLWNASIVAAILAGLLFLFAAAYAFIPRKYMTTP